MYYTGMVQTICVLGRQPEIGLAELESLYGADVLVRLGQQAAGLETPPQIVDFARLGGSTKLAAVLAEVPSTNWKVVEKELLKIARSPSFALPTSGKFHLGLSALGLDISPAKLSALGLTLKKSIRSRREDGSVRLVPNTTAELSTAQVFHNHLADEHGAELLIVAAAGRTIIARTVAVQDIDSYTGRDRGRPKRDARVGMLPPKLAQVIINLANGQVDSNQESRVKSQEKLILDPFCGTGVVLQEALLMRYAVYGTDIDPRMIDYSRTNLEWLSRQYPQLETQGLRLENGDATTHTWHSPNQESQASEITIACETYLGRPFTEKPSREILEQTVREVNTIIKKFLQNLNPQLPDRSRLCIAVPAWSIAKSGYRHLPVLEQLSDLGFERTVFRHSTQPLVYHREDQIVGRELVTLVKK